MKIKRFALGAALAAFAFIALVAATCGSGSTTVQNGDNQPHGVSVAGEGKVQGKPDLALLSLGVSAVADVVASARALLLRSNRPVARTSSPPGIGLIGTSSIGRPSRRARTSAKSSPPRMSWPTRSGCLRQ